MSFTDIPVETDADKLAATALDELTSRIPGFIPREGHLEVILVEVLARIVSEARIVASSIPTAIFRYFGKTVVGLAPIDPVPASTTTTWTMVDTAGYTVAAGTVVAFRTAGDRIVTFETVDEFTVPPGSLATAAGAVIVRATDIGPDANGLTGAMELVDALAFVDSVAATMLTSGGVEGESDDDYLDRLVAELRLLSPRPILPNDFAVMARRVAGVGRATALDGWDPGTGTSGNERMVSVALVDADGNAVSVAVANAVDALLQAEREINFVVHVIDPAYTTIAVDFAVVAHVEVNTTELHAAIVDTIENHLSPENWGGGNESPPVWRNQTIVRYLEVASVIDRVDGVDYITSLTVAGGVVDVNLVGAAPLPQPGAITGTVSEP